VCCSCVLQLCDCLCHLGDDARKVYVLQSCVAVVCCRCVIAFVTKAMTHTKSVSMNGEKRGRGGVFVDSFVYVCMCVCGWVAMWIFLGQVCERVDRV